MVCVDKTLEGMLAEIGNARKIKSDTVVPLDLYPTDPDERAKAFQKSADAHWLWEYSARLGDYILDLGLPIEIKFGRLETNPVQSAMENALYHGHRTGEKSCNMKLPIQVDVYQGEHGIVFTVSDSGEGFDLKEVVQKKRSRQRYFSASNGDGIKVFDDPYAPWQVSGEQSRLNIMYKFQLEQSPFSR